MSLLDYSFSVHAMDQYNKSKNSNPHDADTTEDDAAEYSFKLLNVTAKVLCIRIFTSNSNGIQDIHSSQSPETACVKCVFIERM